MTSSATVGFWSSGDAVALREALDDDVIFSSPYQDYEGRAKATHLLTLVGETLEDLRQSRSWGDGAHRITTFTGAVEGRRLEGVLVEERAAGRVTHVTLFLRPFESLKVAMRVMAGRLAESPAPDGTAP